MKSSLLQWFAARAALAAISASWTWPAGAAGEPPGRPELAHCRSVVTHGKARIEIAQTRRLANPAKGSPHVCRAEVTVRGPAYEELRVYADIDPVGAEFGVAILGQPIGRFRAVAKLGDYDGRLLLVDEGGGVVDLPGPTYLVAGGRFLVLRHHTDAELAITIFDLDARRLVFSAQDDAMAALLRGDAEPGRRGRVQWLEVGGVLHAWLPPGPPASRGVALQLHRALGTLVPATLSPEQIAGAREVAFQGLEAWQNCSCGARPERLRASKEVPAARAGDPARDAVEVIPSVLEAGTRLVEAVRARNVERILAFADDGGIPCVDSVVSKPEFERQLRTKGTWLDAYFLDPATFRARFADRLHTVSFGELVTQDGFAMRVQTGQDPQFTCVRFSSSTGADAELCFALKGKRWVLSDLPNCA